MKIKTVFVDIDTTLTDPKPEKAGEKDRQNEFFAELASKNNKISLEKAIEKIRQEEKAVESMVGKFWPFGIHEKLNVSYGELWEKLSSNAKERLFMHEDAREFLVKLKETHPNIKVCTATTNPRMIIYAKLSVGGLADESGSEFLDEALGGEEVFPGGKACPEFYKALLKLTDSDPESVLMVGDHPELDLKLAQKAGIKHVALPRRNQRQDIANEADGGIYLKRLDIIPDLISS